MWSGRHIDGANLPSGDSSEIRLKGSVKPPQIVNSDPLIYSLCANPIRWCLFCDRASAGRLNLERLFTQDYAQSGLPGTRVWKTHGKIVGAGGKALRQGICRAVSWIPIQRGWVAWAVGDLRQRRAGALEIKFGSASRMSEGC